MTFNFNENQTLSYAGHFESDGAAYDLTLPFDPDCIKLYNYTKYGTAAENAETIWFKDFPAGDAIVKKVIADNGATGDTNLNLELTNGITENDTVAGVTDTHATISGATAASPVVITTSAAHGFANGDRVRITKVLGMTELNDVSRNPYKITVLTTTTFSLQDLDGNNIDGSAFTAYSSGGQVNNLNKTGDDAILYDPPVYKLTLGSIPMANDGDEIFFEVFKYGQYVDLGDIA
ncbi:MAG: ubiquitin-activating E1 FCCH domain-containing protein [Pseudomonadota bacterium]